MNKDDYNGGSYESDDDVSVRSDPPMINEYLTAGAADSALTLQQNDYINQNQAEGQQRPQAASNIDEHNKKSTKPLQQLLQQQDNQQNSKLQKNLEKPNLNDGVKASSPVFTGESRGHKTTAIVSDILQGDYTPVEIPLIEIPGSKPLIFEEATKLLAQVYGSDQFELDDNEEEFLMFTVEIADRRVRRQDGPHQTLRWRKRIRQAYPTNQIDVFSSRDYASEKQVIKEAVVIEDSPEKNIIVVQVRKEASLIDIQDAQIIKEVAENYTNALCRNIKLGQVIQDVEIFEITDADREFFIIDNLAEDYLLLPSEMSNIDEILTEDGPHQTLQWRNKIRHAFYRPQIIASEPESDQDDADGAEQQTRISVILEDEMESKEGTEEATTQEAVVQNQEIIQDDSQIDNVEKYIIIDQTDEVKSVAEQEKEQIERTLFEGSQLSELDEKEGIEKTLLEAAQLGVLSYRGEQQSLESIIQDVAEAYTNELFESANIIIASPDAIESIEPILAMSKEEFDLNEDASVQQDDIAQDDGPPEEELEIEEEQVEVAAVNAHYDTTEGEPLLTQALATTRIVQVDKLRPIYEVLDQEKSKEFESMWVDDLERFKSLTSSQQKSSIAISETVALQEKGSEILEETSMQNIGGEDSVIIEDKAAQQQPITDEVEVSHFYETSPTKDQIKTDTARSAQFGGGDPPEQIEINVEDANQPKFDQSQQHSENENEVDEAIQSEIDVCGSRINLENVDNSEDGDGKQLSDVHKNVAYVTTQSPDSGSEGFQSEMLDQVNVVDVDRRNTAVPSVIQMTPLSLNKGNQNAVRRMSQKVVSAEEKDFANLRQDHARSLIKSNASSVYIRRQMPPKLIVKSKQQHLNNDLDLQLGNAKNPQVPRFPHPQTIDSNKFSALVSAADQMNQLNSPIQKKPRVPKVPVELRASSQSPNPAQKALTESMDKKTIKKPSVPRVSVLMPGAKLILPKKQKEQKQPKNYIQERSLMQTPSVININENSKSLSPPIVQKKQQFLTANKNVRLQTLKSNKRSSQLKSNQIKNLSNMKSRHFRSQLEIPAQSSHNDSIDQVATDTMANSRTAFQTVQNTYGLKRSQHYNTSYTNAFKSSNGSSASPPAGKSKSISIPPLVVNGRQKMPYEQKLVNKLFQTYRQDQQTGGRNSLKIKDESQTKRRIQTSQMVYRGPHDNQTEDARTDFAARQQFDSGLSGANSFSREVMIRLKSPSEDQHLPQTAVGYEQTNHYSNIDNDQYIDQQSDLDERRQKTSLSVGQAVKGIKLFTTLSPRSALKSRVQYQKHLIDKQTLNSNPQDTDQDESNRNNNETEETTILPDNLLSRNSNNNIGEKPEHQKTINSKHHQSITATIPIPRVNPSWAISHRNQQINASMDKLTIYEMLKKNSEAFVQKEIKHITGFKKAQIIQKKNLDWIMTGNPSITLAPIQTKRNADSLEREMEQEAQLNIQNDQNKQQNKRRNDAVRKSQDRNPDTSLIIFQNLHPFKTVNMDKSKSAGKQMRHNAARVSQIKMKKMQPAIDPDFYYGGVGGLGNAGATMSSNGMCRSRDGSAEKYDIGKISSQYATIPRMMASSGAFDAGRRDSNEGSTKARQQLLYQQNYRSAIKQTRHKYLKSIAIQFI